MKMCKKKLFVKSSKLLFLRNLKKYYINLINISVEIMVKTLFYDGNTTTWEFQKHKNALNWYLWFTEGPVNKLWDVNDR